VYEYVCECLNVICVCVREYVRIFINMHTLLIFFSHTHTHTHRQNYYAHQMFAPYVFFDIGAVQEAPAGKQGNKRVRVCVCVCVCVYFPCVSDHA
jgi:hypothetical protein